MKYIFFVTVFLFGSFFVGQKLLAANNDIIINEIGAYPSSTHEWIEVWNKGSESVDLSSWKFWENNTNHSLKAVSTTDSIVSAGEYAVICQDGDVFLRDYPSFVGSVLDSSWIALNESGEEIGLKDETGNFLEKFIYASTTKFSLERGDPFLSDYSVENWQENLFGNTVGAQNSNFLNSNTSSSSTASPTLLDLVNTTTPEIVATNTSTDFSSSTLLSATSSLFDWVNIKLNEILSDPVTGNEMVELYNNSSTTAEISQGSICDESATNCKIFSGEISGFGWLSVDLLSDRYLNNSGDSVILKDEQNNLVDSVVYGTEDLSAPEKNESLIRKIDGVDTDGSGDWAVTTLVTLGAQNKLVEKMVNSNSNSGGSSTGSNNNSTTVIHATSTVTNTTTIRKAVTKDPVNISWQLDWPFGLDVNENGVFSAVGTADPRGGEVNLVWNFGDNASSTGSAVYHGYTTSGIYLVTVLASSTAGTYGKKDFKIYIGSEYSVSPNEIKVGNYLVNASSSEDEFVEIKNFSTSSKNISGWKIKNKSGKEYEVPENTNITVSSTLKFWRSVTHLSFDKDGDTILITTPNNKVIDKVILLSQKDIKKSPDQKDAKIVKISNEGNWQSVQGAVTVLPGVFGSQYFYISGGEKGYQIYNYKKDFPDLKIGDEISAQGTMTQVSGVSRLKISNKNSIKIIKKNENFSPENFGLDEIEMEMVGNLIKVSGDVTAIKSNYLFIDDGSEEVIVYFRSGVKIDKQNLKLGSKLEVTGLVEQSKDGLRISPRNSSDIKIVGFSDELLSQQNEADKANRLSVQEKYLTATAGGVTTLILGFLAKNRGVLVVGGVKKIAGVASKIIRRG